MQYPNVRSFLATLSVAVVAAAGANAGDLTANHVTLLDGERPWLKLSNPTFNETFSIYNSHNPGNASPYLIFTLEPGAPANINAHFTWNANPNGSDPGYLMQLRGGASGAGVGATGGAELDLYKWGNTFTGPVVRVDTDGASYFNGGNVGIGTTTPSATLDVNGDLKTSGKAAIGGGAPIFKVLSARANLDFGSIGVGQTEDKTINVPGVRLNASGTSPAGSDTVVLSVPSNVMIGKIVYSAFVSANDYVTVRALNSGASSQDPANGSFRATAFLME